MAAQAGSAARPSRTGTSGTTECLLRFHQALTRRMAAFHQRFIGHMTSGVRARLSSRDSPAPAIRSLLYFRAHGHQPRCDHANLRLHRTASGMAWLRRVCRLISNPQRIRTSEVTLFYPATPYEMGVSATIFRAVEPGAMTRALQQVDSRLFDEVRLVGSVNNRVITIPGVVAHTAALKIAVVRRQRL